MEHPNIINIYDLPIAANVCNQELREAFQKPEYSIAHVSMAGGNISLYHRHEKITEAYFILEGEGILYVDDSAMHVQSTDYVNIEKNKGHKLKNSNKGVLEHLVIATPSFDPQDVHLLKDRNSYNSKKLNRKRERFAAYDGALVEELNSKEERERLRIGFAYGILPPARNARTHHHNISDEVYFIIKGNGTIKLNNEVSVVQKGSLVYIPKGTSHSLMNLYSKENLEALCLSYPPYQENDFISD
jgi:mannose-6-phosphate isomerase-like protein (cupin superfamily)